MDNADIQEACVSPFPALGCMAAESRFSAATGAESRDPDVVFIRTAQMDPDPFEATVLLTAKEPTSAMHDAGKGVTGTMAAAKPDLWDPEGLVSLRVPANSRVVLAWLGSSAESHAILKHCQGLRRLYVFENNPERLAFLRGRPDVQVLLRDPRVVLLNLPRDKNVSEIALPQFQRDTHFFVEGRIGLYIPDYCRMMERRTCMELEACMLDFTRTTLSRVALHATRGWHMLANSLLNLDRLAMEHTVDELRNTAAGRPVVVVGAGPSLDKCIGELAAHRDRAVIVSCDGAWSTLAHAGIVPDFVVSTDDTEKTWRFFANAEGPQSQVPAVCLLQSNWSVVRYHRGPLFFCRSTSALDQAIDRFVRPVPVLDSGHCVGHAALELAVLLGGSPVILTGFDLAYDGDRFHPEHMPVPYFHDHPPHEKNIMTVPGRDGRALKTDLSMVLYLKEFEKRIAALNRPVLNATVGGALIRGTEHTTLGAALAHGKAIAGGVHPLGSTRVSRDRVTRFKILGTEQCVSLVSTLKKFAERDKCMPAVEGLNPFPFLENHTELLDMISGADNPANKAVFRFAWEDWVRAGARKEQAAEIQSMAAQSVQGVIDLCRLVLSVFNLPVKMAGDQKAQILAVSRQLSDDPGWLVFRERLAQSGFEIADYWKNPDDLPAWWSRLHTDKPGVILSFDGTVFPAGWAPAGMVCLDFRTQPPDREILVEHWLPGYAVIGADAEIADAWNRRLPMDRSAYAVDASGRLVEGRTGRPLDCAELIALLKREITLPQ